MIGDDKTPPRRARPRSGRAPARAHRRPTRDATRERQDRGVTTSSFKTERKEIVHALQRCATAAERCATTAVETDAEQECIQACLDAASLCRVASDLVARGSRYEMWVVPASIFAADTCAEQCLLLPGAHFAECVVACCTVIAMTGGISTEELLRSGDAALRCDDAGRSTRRSA